MKRIVQFVLPVGLLVALLCAAVPARAQASQGTQGDVGEFFDPYKAEKAVEIGTFYLKKKKYDAAIDRFLEAIRYKSNHALAHRLLGEALEKKGELGEAVEYYEKYLKILPSAEDADQVRKRIEKLEKKQKRREERRQKTKN